MTKKCLVCGVESNSAAPSCPACGEASFVELVEPPKEQPVTKPSFRPAKGAK